MIDETTLPERHARLPEMIETRRLVLRPPEVADAEAIALQANDRHLAEMTALIPHPYRIEDARSFIAETAGLPVFAAVRWTDREFLGVGGLHADGDYGFSLGFWLGRAFRGEGLGTEMAQALIDLAFGQFDARHVEVRCRVVNEASRRVIQKCGFQYVGTGMSTSLAAGRVASERYRMERRCWRALKEWGRR